MDSQCYSRIVNYIACELTMPVKKHAYNFVVNDQHSMKHHLLTAATDALKMQTFRPRNLKCHNHARTMQRHSTENNKSNCNSSLQRAQLSENLKDKCIEEEKETKFIEKESESTMSLEYNDISAENNSEFGEETSRESDGDYNEIDENNLQESSKEFYFDDINMCNQKNTKYVSGMEVAQIENEEEWLDNFFFENPTGSEKSCDNFESCNEMVLFFSDPLLLCSEEDFKAMFRMTRTTFKKLVEFLSNEEMEPIENVPLYKKLLIVLWLMGNSGSYSDAAQVFSITEEAAANCFFDVCATLYNRSDNVIKWPSSEESAEIALRMEKKYGFPGVVGVLGCCYFSISIPKEALSRREHFNAKNRTYCIALQIVCDDRLVIRDIFPGLPGSVPETRILRESPLCEQLMCTTEPCLVEPHRHILARSEYPQLKSMLTPYTKTHATLNKDEVEFNKLHESVCQLVDQTFQMLQNRFLTLKLLDPEVATMVLVTACVLHNICVDNDDLFQNTE